MLLLVSATPPGPTEGDESGGGGAPLGATVGGIVAGIVAIIVILLAVFLYRRRKQRNSHGENHSGSSAQFFTGSSGGYPQYPYNGGTMNPACPYNVSNKTDSTYIEPDYEVNGLQYPVMPHFCTLKIVQISPFFIYRGAPPTNFL